VGSGREQLVRGAIDAFNRKDPEGFFHLLHPDVEWIETPQYPGAATYRGHAGVAESLQKWWETWGDMVTTVERVVEDGDTLVALGRTTVTSVATELSFDSESGVVYEFEEDLVFRVRLFLTQAEALEAAGLA
jgi:ketosteroid isomerase-like protein